jgi:hypothetical protein
MPTLSAAHGSDIDPGNTATQVGSHDDLDSESAVAIVFAVIDLTGRGGS